MPTSVQLITISGSSYFLRLDWSGPDLSSGFQLLLTDAQHAWRGEVTQAAFGEEAKELEMDIERYALDVQQALTGTECSTSYSFTLSGSGACVSLSYEKVQKDISFRLGSVALTALSDPAEAVRDLLTYSMNEGNAMERHNRKLDEQNQRLRREHQCITAQLKRYASGKEALELELYSRFVHVLNEKKAKIRSLHKTLTSLQEERSSVGKTEQTRPPEHNDEDEYGGSTEDETEEAEPKPIAKSPTESETKECTNPLDDSLGDLTDVAPCRKRRFRHLETPRPAKSHTYKKRRSESPAALSVEQAPHCSTDAVAATSDAEDLFEDF
ncbi:DNA repair protein XRCC4 isoform X2 [Eucyclogobius newberryi]|uniref:DNA repair protein XRCC4 isoform X2 n=1 Tax=Eucyclogobius newberryi TaxID=166745 RepID=UPI003B5C1116